MKLERASAPKLLDRTSTVLTKLTRIGTLSIQILHIIMRNVHCTAFDECTYATTIQYCYFSICKRPKHVHDIMYNIPSLIMKCFSIYSPTLRLVHRTNYFEMEIHFAGFSSWPNYQPLNLYLVSMLKQTKFFSNLTRSSMSLIEILLKSTLTTQVVRCPDSVVKYTNQNFRVLARFLLCGILYIL